MLERFRNFAPGLIFIILTGCSRKVEFVDFKLMIDMPEKSSYVDIDAQREYRESVDRYESLNKEGNHIQMAMDGRPIPPTPVVINDKTFIEFDGVRYRLGQVKDMPMQGNAGEVIYLSNGLQRYKLAYVKSGIIHVLKGNSGIVVTYQPSL